MQLLGQLEMRVLVQIGGLWKTGQKLNWLLLMVMVERVMVERVIVEWPQALEQQSVAELMRE